MAADILFSMACEREERESDSITLAQLSVGMYHTPGHSPAIYPLEATLVSALQDFGLVGKIDST